MAEYVTLPPGYAQASRTFVSGAGDDANPCSRIAPCKTFAGAISKTIVNGEINCLDPGGFGAVTITKSITIDCHEVFASILHSGTNGVNIPFDSFNAADVRKTVRLRNLNLNGTSTGVNGVRITGSTVIAGGAVFIEECLIDGDFAGQAIGIGDERTGGGKLSISNTTVTNTGLFGIHINPAFGNAAGQRIDAVLDNVRVQNSVFGIGVGNNARVMINRSVVSVSSQAGVAVVGALAAAEANISNSVISNNLIGVQNNGGTVTIRLSNNDIAFNGTAFVGATQTFSNNRIQGMARWARHPLPSDPPRIRRVCSKNGGSSAFDLIRLLSGGSGAFVCIEEAFVQSSSRQHHDLSTDAALITDGGRRALADICRAK